MNWFSIGAAAAAVAAGVAGGAGAQVSAQATDQQPGLLDLIAPDRIAALLANSLIAGLRTQMEFTYDHLSTDILRGSIAISAVTARPLLRYDLAGQCTVTADRVQLGSDVWQSFEPEFALSFNIVGLRATLACLDRESAVMLRSAGYAEIAVDQVRVQWQYLYATGETALDATVAVNGFATLDLSASGTVLPQLGDYGLFGISGMRLSRAVVTLRDQGGWAAASAMLPPNLRDPAAIQVIGTEGLTQALTQGGTRQISAVERNFVTDLMAQVAAYVATPGEITIEADIPPGGITVMPWMLDDPVQLIEALALRARAVPLARTGLLDVAALQDIGQQSGAARIALARAMLVGDGVPRVPAMVPEMLADLVAAGGPEAGVAASLTAEALQDSDPAAAYALALTAGAARAEGAMALLDRLEQRITTAMVLEAQTAVAGQSDPLTAITGKDPRTLRQLALENLIGLGKPRSYARAYYYALLAEATGDPGAGPLRQEIEGRFAARGDAVAEAWQQMAAQVQAEALNDWIASDMPARYRSE